VKDTAIHYSNKLPSGINDWKIECKARWTAGYHGTINLAAITDKHSYLFSADGWYNEFYLYHDSRKILEFGHFVDVKDEWVTLRIEKKGNQISIYFNGNLENTYTETYTTSYLLDATWGRFHYSLERRCRIRLFPSMDHKRHCFPSRALSA